MKKRSQDVDVVIGGGGITGLLLADLLRSCHITYQVSEASERIGGRIHDTRMRIGRKSLVVPRGAEFAHLDKKGKTMWPVLSDEYDIRLNRVDETGVTIFENQILQDQRDRTTKSSGLMERIRGRIDEYFRDGGKDMIFNQWVIQQSEKVFQTEGEQELFHAMVSNDLGLGIHHLPLSTFAKERNSYEMTDFRPEGGLGALTAKIASRVRDCIVTNAPTNSVEWNDDSVRVCLSKGRTIHAKTYVSTLPVDRLKAGHPQLDPALPLELRHALKNINAVPVSKSLIEFNERILPAKARVVRGGPMQLAWSLDGDTTGKHLLTLCGGTKAKNTARLSPGVAARKTAHEILDSLGTPNSSNLYVNGNTFHWPNGYSCTGLKTKEGSPRERFAEHTGPLLFAGEWTDPIYPSSTIGGMRSAIRAAVSIIERMDCPMSPLLQALADAMK